jgi:hypothetical protein
MFYSHIETLLLHRKPMYFLRLTIVLLCMNDKVVEVDIVLAINILSMHNKTIIGFGFRVISRMI